MPVVRAMFAAATVVATGLGLAVGDARFLAAGATFGIVWTVWDVLWDRVFGPAGDWLTRVLTEGVSGQPPVDTRPTLDDTIRLLENHLARDASRSVHIQAATRLEEIYRTVKRDPKRAQEVIRRVRERYPDADELEPYQRDRGAEGPRDDGPEG